MTPEQLKASILQRAMEGKLVPQNPNDEPASELLKRIKAEKEKLISEGKIKRDKKETEIFRGDDGKHYGKFADGSTQEIDVPYDIPDTWEWVRIKSIYWNFGQNKPEKSFRYIDTSSIDRKKNIINYKNLQYLSPEQAPSRARKLVSQNSVLFSTVRPYLKNIAVVRELKEYLIASTAFIVLDTLLNETYLKYYLLSDNFINRVNNKSTGTSYPAINDYNFNLLLIALPPLSEQDPNDESVEVLLEKIRAEKQKLFEEGKIKKKDLDISIVSQGDDNSYYEEVPCEIPESWEWVRLNDITSYIQRGKSPKYSNIPIYPVIAQKCNQWSGFSIDLARFIDPKTVHSYQKERLLRDGDLMWNSTGLGTLGRLAIYHENKNPYGWAVADSHVTVIRVLSGVINCHFIYNFLSSPIVQSVIEEKASGSTKQKELLTKTIKEYLIPLPPLPEQSRIVDKIEQFFAHIDALI
ncbi:restriction endonuclease subunit S [Streptococcus pneumoniae]|uniref:restriction endonuclease subunit S n=1 Tax=Streptococcus pneumoniae TaxID=1313 RepID=UPI000B761CE8|nr:restriction endonuclease subunit S [Streptococcus pneumoniae]SNK79886.1 type I restriction-modification system S protein [Streptococcus pneumoniae]